MQMEDQVRQMNRTWDIKRLLANLISSLSPGFIAKIGKAFGTLFYFADIRHRRIVRRNLQFIYPSWPDDLIVKTSRRIFQNTGIAVFEIFQMRYFTREDVLKKSALKERRIFTLLRRIRPAPF